MGPGYGHTAEALVSYKDHRLNQLEELGEEVALSLFSCVVFLVFNNHYTEASLDCTVMVFDSNWKGEYACVCVGDIVFNSLASIIRITRVL